MVQFMLLKVFLMVAKVNLGGLATMLTKRQLYVSVWELYRFHVRYCTYCSATSTSTVLSHPF